MRLPNHHARGGDLSTWLKVVSCFYMFIPGACLPVGPRMTFCPPPIGRIPAYHFHMFTMSHFLYVLFICSLISFHLPSASILAGADGSGGWNLRIAKKIDPQILLYLTTGTPNFGDAPPCRFLALDPKLQAGGLRGSCLGLCTGPVCWSSRKVSLA